MTEPQFAHRPPASALRGQVTSYYGFLERTAAPLRRREGPGTDVVIVISFGEEWLIDGRRHSSFAGGLHESQVTTEHQGRSHGMQINVSPPAAYMLFEQPLDALANTTVPLEDALGEASLPERLHEAGGWSARFHLLDRLLSERLAEAAPARREVVWAWGRLCSAHGNVRIAELADELGWSRRRLVARFREQVGLPPKAAARMLRFEHARALAESAAQPDWARIALECGYYDQSHLINEFRAVTGQTPVTFFQDTADAAA
jgi:AraC-like DNA-binding protein